MIRYLLWGPPSEVTERLALCVSQVRVIRRPEFMGLVSFPPNRDRVCPCMAACTPGNSDFSSCIILYFTEICCPLTNTYLPRFCLWKQCGRQFPPHISLFVFI